MAHSAPSNSLALLLLLLFITSIQAAQGSSTSHPSPVGHVPMRVVVYRSVDLATTTAAARDEGSGGGGGGGGRYEPFQLCMGCRCCTYAAAGNNASSSSSCVDTRCCYAIDCNVPGKPFGVCAFTPHTCGCGGDDVGADNCTAHQ